MITAAPSAWRTRRATSVAADGAVAHSAEAAVNVSSPARKLRFRPTRSATRPAGTSSAAKAML